MSERLTKSLREFIPILNKNGFKLARTNGSHFIFVNRVTHRHISVNKDLNKMVRLRLIKEYHFGGISYGKRIYAHIHSK